MSPGSQNVGRTENSCQLFPLERSFKAGGSCVTTAISLSEERREETRTTEPSTVVVCVWGGKWVHFPLITSGQTAGPRADKSGWAEKIEKVKSGLQKRSFTLILTLSVGGKGSKFRKK